MAINQVVIEGTLRKGRDILPNKEGISEMIFIEYPDEYYNLMCTTLLQSDDITMDLLKHCVGEKVMVTGKIDEAAIRVQDFSCLK